MTRRRGGRTRLRCDGGGESEARGVGWGRLFYQCLLRPEGARGVACGARLGWQRAGISLWRMFLFG